MYTEFAREVLWNNHEKYFGLIQSANMKWVNDAGTSEFGKAWQCRQVWRVNHTKTCFDSRATKSVYAGSVVFATHKKTYDIVIRWLNVGLSGESGESVFEKVNAQRIAARD